MRTPDPGPRTPKLDFSLYLVTDRNATSGRSLFDVLGKCLDAGARAIQLREKDLSGRELYELASELRALTRQYGARLLINDRIDIALAVDADGVHLPSDSFPPTEARRLLGSGKLIGVSTHSLDQAKSAEKEGADFIVFGPVFDTPSKRGYGPPLGIDALAKAADALGKPVFAIGGISVEDVPRLRKAGARGVAAISAILSSPDPGRAVRRFIGALGGA
ncbi:MAG TPA: thiamine phosphate synthase [Methylomirabilota bacterium]|nr:thiamine phosphate synthase [Methylomirabilota bacterium]